jgi:hypothetical protein
MQGISCYNEATKNARAVLPTPASVADSVSGLRSNETDMPKNSTPVSTPTNKRNKVTSELIGQRFGMLVVVCLVRGNYVRVRCDCGNEKELRATYLFHGQQSCGCQRATKFRNFRHGMAHAPIYAVWGSMRARCQNPKDRRYARYGGRGIAVCERWQTFENFYADMGDVPKGMSIERVDNDKGYEPGNCVWATSRTQANNRRNNTLITAHGETHTIAEWARINDITPGSIYRRRRQGLTDEEAIATPSARYRGKRKR